VLSGRSPMGARSVNRLGPVVRFQKVHFDAGSALVLGNERGTAVIEKVRTPVIFLDLDSEEDSEVRRWQPAIAAVQGLFAVESGWVSRAG
jgi:hypothetical protein